MRFRLFLNVLVFAIVPLALGVLSGWLTWVVLKDTDSRGAFWFNGVVVRALFLGLLVATVAGVIGGYIVRVVVPKYHGRPVS
ncbi:MAG: hypothetical protein ACOYNI_08010 [Acidimicrobiia bacterium]